MAGGTAARLMALFAGRADAHGTHEEPEADERGKQGIKRSARTLREPVTEVLWEDHLAGKKPLGVIPIREDSTCLWGSIDDDDYERDHLETIHRVEALGFPLVPCWSKSGGLHLFLFLTEPAPASMVQKSLRRFAARLGLASCEIFPKQQRVAAEHGDVGNWMVMPYFGSTFGGKIREQVGVKNTGDTLGVVEFLDLAEKSRQVPEEIEARAEASAAGARVTRSARRGASEEVVELKTTRFQGPFSDGPPCLQHLSAGKVGRGHQNNFLLMVGIYNKKKFPEEWKDHLEAANHEYLEPPGTVQGLTSVIRSLEKKDYEYTCKAEPMCSHCDSMLCRTRRYGVGGGAAVPPVTAIRKLDTDPPMWFVDIDGQDKPIEVTNEQFMYYNKFQLVCLAKTRPPTIYQGMKQSDWTKLIGSFEITVVEAPVEIGRPGEFKEHLDSFLTNSQAAAGNRKEDVENGQPWEDQEDGTFYFRFNDLCDYIRGRGRMPNADRRDIQRWVEELGGGRRKKGGGIGLQKETVQLYHGGPRVWGIPSEVVERAPKLVPPEPPKDPV